MFGVPKQQSPCSGDLHVDVHSFGKLLKLLLPESKYSKLRSECLKVDPDKRISMREISDYFEAQLKKGSSASKTLLIIACAAIAVISVGLLTFWNVSVSPQANTDSH